MLFLYREWSKTYDFAREKNKTKIIPKYIFFFCTFFSFSRPVLSCLEKAFLGVLLGH